MLAEVTKNFTTANIFLGFTTYEYYKFNYKGDTYPHETPALRLNASSLSITIIVIMCQLISYLDWF